MIHIIYFEYSNTKGNHAGMAHLFRSVKNKYPEKIRLIKIPFLNSILANKFNSFRRLIRFLTALYFRIIAKKDDLILLSEYLSARRSGEQHLLIDHLLKIKGLKVFALVHLPLMGLKMLHTDQMIEKSVKKPHKIIVFGSNLKKELSTMVDVEKIITTFHYADTSFYIPSSTPKSEFRVVAMGSLYRDKEALLEVVTTCKDTQFDIVFGQDKMNEAFMVLQNVNVYGFVTEQELLSLMQNATVSLNILKDTVGSNVITTSLATGLVIVVNNIGSIGDYCNSNNAVICENTAQICEAIYELKNNLTFTQRLSQEAVLKAQQINLQASIDFFSNLDTL